MRQMGIITDRRMVSGNETENNTGPRQEAKERPGDKEMEYLKQSLEPDCSKPGLRGKHEVARQMRVTG
mgnify:CR=1 FL=1